MAKAPSRQVAFPWTPLRRPLSARQRAELAAHLRALARWQESLAGWPKLRGEPGAVPFVSLYERGRIVGCQGSGEGLSRAFLEALHDRRAPPFDRSQLAAQVSYPIAPRRIAGADELELGAEGLALVPVEGRPAILLPDVACDSALDREGMLRALLAKAGAGRAEVEMGALFAFRTERVANHDREVKDPVALGRAWLLRQIDASGRIAFAVDARQRVRHDVGEMFHGRASLLLRVVRSARAREWLQREVSAALRGRTVAGWPDDPDRVAGTLALCVMAGLPFARELRGMRPTSAWHAAQAVTALGRDAPDEMYRLCLADLPARPLAPWTLLAARARGDQRVVERVARGLTAELEGGCFGHQTALTALAVEALVGLAKVPRARAFLRTMQLVRVPAALDRAAALGAFRAAPHVHGLRIDVTAHALMALGS